MTLERFDRLQTRIFGRALSNPLVVASGPLSESEKQIRRAFSAGAGAVVTKTIYEGERRGAAERALRTPLGLLNSTTYSRRSSHEWAPTIRRLADDALPVLVSIHGHTPYALGELARTVEAAGAWALELGIACPNDGSQQDLTPEVVADYTRAVTSAVTIPCSVKLTATDSCVAQARAASEAGASAITLSDALPAVRVLIEQRTLDLGGYVGYSGPAIKPLVQYAIHRVRDAGIDCAVFGAGGVGSAADVIEYLELGVCAVQIYTALTVDGWTLLSDIDDALQRWCVERATNVQELIGTIHRTTST